MRLLDLFCGAGGAAMGYHRAGFEDITGVDIVDQPNYPFVFERGDALEYVMEHGHEFDVIHASPPCQTYSVTANLHENVYPDLLEPTRDILSSIGKPYVIENVPGAPLENYLILCGTMFGLRVRRHRLFECHPPIYFAPYSCNHYFRTGGDLRIYQTVDALNNGKGITVAGKSYELTAGSIAMDIDWMNKAELSQAIPPAYTEFIGRRIMGCMV